MSVKFELFRRLCHAVLGKFSSWILIILAPLALASLAAMNLFGASMMKVLVGVEISYFFILRP